MRAKCERPEQQAYPAVMSPEWHVTLRRAEEKNGRSFIYYDFEPSPQAPEVELLREEPSVQECC